VLDVCLEGGSRENAHTPHSAARSTHGAPHPPPNNTHRAPVNPPLPLPSHHHPLKGQEYAVHLEPGDTVATIKHKLEQQTQVGVRAA
jgi:hypothetical protein